MPTTASIQSKLDTLKLQNQIFSDEVKQEKVEEIQEIAETNSSVSAQITAMTAALETAQSMSILDQTAENMIGSASILFWASN
jgi:chromatin segregation and condensation protein Rec8/ScpA/Scc1 (kleisin family)